MGAPTLDIAAALSKVKKNKKAPKKSDGKSSTRTGGNRRTAQDFIRNVQGQGGKSTPAAAAAAKPVAKQRTIPLGQRLRYVFDFAKQKRKILTYEEIKKETQVAITSELLPLLQAHTSLTVNTDAQTIKYKPEYAIQTKDELHLLVRQHPFGLLSTVLADSYPEAITHIAELVEDELVFEVDSTEKNSSVLYPNEFRLAGGPPDESTCDMLLSVALPEAEADVDAALQAAGIAKAKRSTARLKMAVISDDRNAGKKKKKERKIRNMTNAHMQHLFDGHAGDTID